MSWALSKAWLWTISRPFRRKQVQHITHWTMLMCKLTFINFRQLAEPFHFAAFHPTQFRRKIGNEILEICLNCYLTAAWQMELCCLLQIKTTTSTSASEEITTAATSRAVFLEASQGVRRAATSCRTPSWKRDWYNSKSLTKTGKGRFQKKQLYLRFHFQTVMSWISPKAQPVRPSLEDWLKWKMPFENLIFWTRLAVCLEFEQRNFEEPTKPWMAGISIAASTSSCSLPDWKSQVKKSLKRMKGILGSTINKEQNVLRNLVKTKWEGVTTKDIDCQSPVKVH